MFHGIKKAAVGTTVKKTAPLKYTTGEIIVERNDQMVLNMLHEKSAIKMHRFTLKLDAQPTIEELSKAIDTLPSRKTPGSDGIPPEVIKCGKPALLESLHELLCLCWEEGAVP